MGCNSEDLFHIFKSSCAAAQIRVPNGQERWQHLDEYILKMKTIVDNLIAISESVKEKDQILHILRGLGLNYISIVASLTTREDDLSFHYVQSILLTHEERLQLQHVVPAYLTSITNLATSSIHSSSSMHNRRSQPISTLNQPSFYRSYRPSLPKQYYFGHHQRQAPSIRTQCQLYGKCGHTACNFYHRFDLCLQDPSQTSVSPNPCSTT